MRELSKLSIRENINWSRIVLLPREDLFIMEQWHQQWKEERVMEKKDTSLKFNKPMFDNLLACLPSTSDIQSIFFSLNPNFRRTSHESNSLFIPNQLMGKNVRLEIYSQK